MCSPVACRGTEVGPFSQISPFHSVRFLTTAIVSEMGYASGTHREVLFTIGLVLFVFIMIINLVLTYILKKGDCHD